MAFVSYQQLNADGTTESKRKPIAHRRCDVMLPSNVNLEIQHTYISWDDIRARKVDWKYFSKDIVWLLDGNTPDVVVDELSDGTYLINFKNPWKYKSFIGMYKYVLLDITDRVFKIPVDEVKCTMVQVKRWYSMESVVGMLKQSPTLLWDMWDDCNSVKSKLTVHQCGAGNGKTYGIWKSICENRDKQTFVIVTKQHSAKAVIFAELNEQAQRNEYHISYIQGYTSIIKESKHCVVKYEHKISCRSCVVIIGTIDSLICNLIEYNSCTPNLFNVLPDMISENGANKVNGDGNFTFGGENIRLNRQTEIWIDESQDLNVNYLHAFVKLMLQTGVEMQIVGDKLQSLTSDVNIFTEISTNKSLPNIDVVIKEKRNDNMRIKVPHMNTQINEIVKFKDYDLLEINVVSETAVLVDDVTSNEDKPMPLEVIDQPIIKRTGKQEEMEQMKIFVDSLIEKVDFEVVTNRYVPEDFLFIFPIMKSNELANELENRLNDYWTNKFKDEGYRECVKNNEHWMTHDHEHQYTQYAYLHKHDEGTVIDLNDSIHTTRLVTIRTSKGDGRNVVFVLNCTERLLKYMTDGEINLRYESYLHVALTRAKRKMYFGLTHNNDDICQRFIKTDIVGSVNIAPSLSTHYSIEKMIKDIPFIKAFYESSIFTDTHLKAFVEEKLKSLNPIKKPKNVDWKFHCIRRGIIYNVIWLKIIENIPRGEHKQQELYVLMSKFSQLRSDKHYNSKEFYNFLRSHQHSSYAVNNEDLLREFPICECRERGTSLYREHEQKFKDMLTQVQRMCSFKRNVCYEAHTSNVLQMVVLYYALLLLKNRNTDHMTPYNVYDIMNYFYTRYDNKEHRFLQTIPRVDHVCDTVFKNIYRMSSSTIKWNVEKSAYMKGLTDDFSIKTRVSFIGRDNERVYHLHVVSDLCDLNKHEVVADILLKRFLIQNCKRYEDENNDMPCYYENKPVTTFLVTLNESDPIHEINWDFISDDHTKQIVSLLKTYTTRKTHNDHVTLFKYCTHVKRLQGEKFGRDTQHKTPYTYILQELKSQPYGCPKYVERFFMNLNDDPKSDTTKKVMNDCDMFCKRLDDMFEKAFDMYCGVDFDTRKDDDDDDSFF